MRLRLAVLGGFLLLACTPISAQPFDLGDLPVTDAVGFVDNPFADVAFQSPLGLRDPGDGYFYVPEYDGRVRVFEAVEGVSTSSIFLDISARILATSPRGEFYTLEFHPDYAQNGYVYVTYLLGGAELVCVLSRFTRSADDPLRVDPASEQVILEVPEPAYAHSMNDLAFGPDGYLYVSVGDGGEFLDPDGNAQNPGTLLGSILRLDVDNPSGGRAYGIPPDNPFVGNTQGWREEVYAYGFRNPWRLSFDRLTGELYVGDVGEVTYEEVSRVVAGGNYGWNRMEAAFCYPPDGPQDCDRTGLREPVFYYGRDLGSSVTGGYVYRGSRVPDLYGYYVFADFASRGSWAVDLDNPDNPNGLIPVGNQDASISSLGQDQQGELYFSRFFGGLTRLDGATGVNVDSLPSPTELLFRTTPNPMRGRGYVQLRSGTGAEATVVIYDMLGREVETVFEGPLGEGALYLVPLDVSDLPAGVYIARLRVGGEASTRKFTVVR